MIIFFDGFYFQFTFLKIIPLIDFEVNYKFRPPLRDGTTLKSLVKGVLDRSIDIIVSDHTPWDTEKDLEFPAVRFWIHQP